VGQPQPGPVTPPPDATRRPLRIEPVEGTPYGLAIYATPPATSGPAVGSLVAGIAGIVVSLVVSCLGIVGLALATEGEGAGGSAVAALTFTVLAVFLGLAGIGLGVVGLRQTRPQQQPAGTQVRGRGMAIAGLVCGSVGVAVALCSLGLAGIAALS
jgi:hypothetical protein